MLLRCTGNHGMFSPWLLCYDDGDDCYYYRRNLKKILKYQEN